LVGFDVDGIVGDDLKDEVDAALEVKAGLDFFARWIGENDGQNNDGEGQNEFPLEPFFHAADLSGFRLLLT
jgi:hypothetical protein